MGRGILGAIVVGALLAPAQAADAAPLRLGMVFKYLASAPGVSSPVTSVARSLDGLALELRWFRVQPTCGAIRRGEYLWEQADRAMELARAQGLPVTLTLTKGASCTAPGPGDEPTAKWQDDWARFVAAAARRYGSDPVTGIEVWSEPNLHKDFGGPPSAYGRFFLKTERTVRRADPDVRVLVGGLGFCCGPHLWVRQLYKSKSMRRRGRHIGAHPYSPSPAVAIKRLRLVRRELPRRSDITITEHGWSTCPRPTETKQRKCVTPEEQARQMERYIELLRLNKSKLDLRAFYWFQSQDFAEPEHVAECDDSPKGFYGIWTFAGHPKPSHAVWEEATGTDLPQVIPENPLVRPCRE